MAVQKLTRTGKPALAYVKGEPPGQGKKWPWVMFLHGFRSDMEGTKALYLEEKCRGRGQGFVRFDYSGHGISEGNFENGTISQWKDDALAILDDVVQGPVLLVGSSMGGWISLLLAKLRPERVAGFIGLAAAPDFTRQIRNHLNQDQLTTLNEKGFIELANDYSPEPYVITKNLIEDGEQNCLMDNPINLSIPVRLMQGMRDTDVEWQTAHRIKKMLTGDDVDVYLREQGDHRLSQPADLELLDKIVVEMSEKIS